MKIQEQLRKALLDEGKEFDEIIGQESAKHQIKSALVAGRHMLIVGPPGIGKTTLAKNISQILPTIEVNDCEYHCDPQDPICPACKTGQTKKKKKITGIERFVRVQGSPDLTAEDLIGDIDPAKAIKYGPLSIEAFTPGKIFKANNGVLFFDELNRAPEKLQNALLQALQERVVTIGSYRIDLAANFLFIATMNPEDSSTEPVSDVLLDRFDVAYMDYPETLANEINIVSTKAQTFIEFPSNALNNTVLFVRFLRESDKLEKLPSVRASIGLYERAQTNAMLKKRKIVSWNDVIAVMTSVLAHRIKLKPSSQYLQSTQELIHEKMQEFSEKHQLKAESDEGEVP